AEFPIQRASRPNRARLPAAWHSTWWLLILARELRRRESPRTRLDCACEAWWTMRRDLLRGVRGVRQFRFACGGRCLARFCLTSPSTNRGWRQFRRGGRDDCARAFAAKEVSVAHSNVSRRVRLVNLTPLVFLPRRQIAAQGSDFAFGENVHGAATWRPTIPRISFPA